MNDCNWNKSIRIESIFLNRLDHFLKRWIFFFLEFDLNSRLIVLIEFIPIPIILDIHFFFLPIIDSLCSICFLSNRFNMGLEYCLQSKNSP